jgi:phosphatidylglycerol---prolipoprotein diacylglyceryl transferase
MMKFPFYLQIGETKILLHTLMEPLAFFIGFRYFLWLKKRKGDILKDDNRTWIIIAAIFGALLGSRLVGGFEDPIKLSGAKNWLIHFYSNKTVLGGFLGALFAVELVKKIIGVKTASGDLFVYPILLALIIGRIGCFSMGIYEDTYGYPTVSVFGMDLGDGIARHPVTLYEIFYLMVSWMFLYLLEQKKIFENGALFKIFMITYIVFRFLLEYIKPHYTYSIGLSAIQIACFMGLIWYAPFIINPWKLLRNPK